MQNWQTCRVGNEDDVRRDKKKPLKLQYAVLKKHKRQDVKPEECKLSKKGCVIRFEIVVIVFC